MVKYKSTGYIDYFMSVPTYFTIGIPTGRVLVMFGLRNIFMKSLLDHKLKNVRPYLEGDEFSALDTHTQAVVGHEIRVLRHNISGKCLNLFIRVIFLDSDIAGTKERQG